MNALHAPTLLAPLVQQFFTERLIAQRNMSPRTVAAYRDTFRLLLVWFEQKLHKAPSRLALTDLDVTRISAFLDYLEIERHNTIRSRNARFAALRSFLNFATRKEPAALGTIQGVLAVPMKRFERPLLGYLTREEIEAVLDAPEGNTWCGQRDRVMLMMLYNTGARVSELIRLTPGSVVLEGSCGAQIPVRGRSGGFIALTSRRRGALAGMMAAGALGVAVAGLSHCGHFQAKGAANSGKPLSAAAVDCAAAAASATSLARRRSALLDPGKSMVD